MPTLKLGNIQIHASPMRLKQLGSSKLSLLFVLLFIWSALLINKQWTPHDRVISNDLNFYYIYLPATFIYHDLTFNYVNNKLPIEVFRSSWTLTTPNKRHVSKMSSGFAIMLTPFFLMAHFYELITNGPANGYTDTYSLFICLATFFYLMIGLVYQHKTLSHFFDERTTSFTIVGLGLATNIYYYSTYAFSNPHVFSFCLFSIFIWKTIQWHHKSTLRDSILLGLLLGLITIMRPNNVVIVLFPLLFGVYNRSSLMDKMKLMTQNKMNILVAILAFGIGILPQLIIWKIQTGHFIYYSYQKEHFYFSHPHVLDGFFSFRNGMFIYAPVLLLVIPGFIFVWKKGRQFAMATSFFFVINAIIVFSWWCWWYGGSFGIRAMIESYAILALPIGCFIQEFGKANKWRNYAITIFIGLCVVLNQFQCLQEQTSLLHYSDMTFKTYKLIFGRLTWPAGYAESLNHPDIEKAFMGEPERNFTATFPFLQGGKFKNVSFKAANGMFVSADLDVQNKLIADRRKPNNWEIFRMDMEDFGTCHLHSWNNKFVYADPYEHPQLTANRDQAGNWETFFVESFPNNKFAIKAASNNKYIKLNQQNNNLLEATSEVVGANELFEIIPQ